MWWSKHRDIDRYMNNVFRHYLCQQDLRRVFHPSNFHVQVKLSLHSIHTICLCVVCFMLVLFFLLTCYAIFTCVCLDLMKPNYWLSCDLYVVFVLWMNVPSTLGLRKLANLLYGNKLERLKKRESCVHSDFKVVFHA